MMPKTNRHSTLHSMQVPISISIIQDNKAHSLHQTPIFPCIGARKIQQIHTTHLSRNQRKRRKRRDADARQFSQCTERARDICNGGFVRGCGVYWLGNRQLVWHFLLFDILVGEGKWGNPLNGTPMSQR